jgi:hypothetical protein
MKKIIYLTVLVFICFSCNKTKEFYISGEVVNDFEGKEIHLAIYDSTWVQETVLVAMIQDNQFLFSGSYDYPKAALLKVENDSTVRPRVILIEPGKVQVLLNRANNLFVSGTPANKSYQNALSVENKLKEMEFYFFQETQSGAVNFAREREFEKEYNAQFEKITAAYTDFFKKNINNPLGIEIFETSEWTWKLSANQLESILKRAGEEYQKRQSYSYFMQRVEEMKAY